MAADGACGYNFARSSTFILLFSTLPFLSTAKPECGKDFYYDDVTGKCDSCSLICSHAHTQDTVKQCREMCPGWTEKTSSTSTSAPTVPANATDDSFHGNARVGQSLADIDRDSNPLVWCLIGVLIVVSLVGLVVLVRRRVVTWLKGTCSLGRRQCNRRPQQETGPESENLNEQPARGPFGRPTDEESQV